jgi:hypothetical protein
VWSTEIEAEKKPEYFRTPILPVEKLVVPGCCHLIAISSEEVTWDLHEFKGWIQIERGNRRPMN